MRYSSPQKQHRQKEMFERQQNAMQYHHTQGQILQGNVINIWMYEGSNKFIITITAFIRL